MARAQDALERPTYRSLLMFVFVRSYGYDFLHVGAVVGARLALRGGSSFVRTAFIVIVGLLILRTAWTAIRGN